MCDFVLFNLHVTQCCYKIKIEMGKMVGFISSPRVLTWVAKAQHPPCMRVQSLATLEHVLLTFLLGFCVWSLY